MPGSQSEAFVANPDGYHKHTAHVLAKLSYYVSKVKDEAELLRKAQEHVRFDTVSTFGLLGNEAVIFENQDCAVVVWRGSQNSYDWKDNLTGGLTPYEVQGVRGNFRTGFWDHTDDLWEEGAPDGVSAKLQQLTAGTSRKVFFTGHSLGGACAVISACRFIKEQNGLSKLAQIVTMGQPRTVDDSFAEFLSTRVENKYFRFVVCGDSIPRLPPNLRHGGALKFITSEPAIYTNPPRSVVVAHTAIFRKNFLLQDRSPAVPDSALDGTPAGTIIYHKVGMYSERILSPEKEILVDRLLTLLDGMFSMEDDSE